METNRTLCDKYNDYIIGKTEGVREFRTAYKFPNGYGASVIDGYFGQGLELAVLYFEGDKPHISAHRLQATLWRISKTRQS